jgi:transposase
MSVKNQMEHDLVNRAIRGEMTAKQAARMLGRSYRQTKRLIAKVRRQGMAGVKHGNLGKKPWNLSSPELKQQVITLLRDRYFDFNLTHFAEKLRADHGIDVKRETLRNWAHEERLVKRAHHDAYRKPKIHRTRHRLPRAGMMLQMDGSTHRWIGATNPEACLIGTIDDATSICPYGEFFPGEDTLSVMTVLMRTIERVGVPEILYVDQAGHFGKLGTREKYVDWERHVTHVERAMAELGCRVLFAPTPQAKGRIERMWNTFQDRLIPELRIRSIGRIPSANAFLQNHFIPQFNQSFGKIASNPEPAFRPVPAQWSGRLDEVFVIRDWRKVTRGETISWDGQIYSVKHDYNQSLRGLQIELRTKLDGTWSAYHALRPVKLEILKLHPPGQPTATDLQNLPIERSAA